MPRFAANIGWMAQEVPMLERFRLVRDLGFTAVECPLIYDHEPAGLGDACAAAELGFLMFNAPPGDMAAGEYGISALPGREQEFQDSIGRALDYAKALKSGFVHVLAGIVPSGEKRERCFEAHVENLIWAAQVLSEAGIGVLVEPINTYERPGYLTTTTKEAKAVLDAAGHDNIAIQYDFHNAQFMEGSLTATLEEHLPVIRHMQIAGVPGRTPPDEGEMNIAYLFDLVDRLGYTGWIGCEYRPHHATSPGATKASLGWARPFGLG